MLGCKLRGMSERQQPRAKNIAHAKKTTGGGGMDPPRPAGSALVVLFVCVLRDDFVYYALHRIRRSKDPDDPGELKKTGEV